MVEEELEIPEFLKELTTIISKRFRTYEDKLNQLFNKVNELEKRITNVENNSNQPKSSDMQNNLHPNWR